MASEELFIQLSLWMVNLCHLLPFPSILSYKCGSGSTKLLNTDPIRIRIHNTARFKQNGYRIFLNLTAERKSSLPLSEVLGWLDSLHHSIPASHLPATARNPVKCSHNRYAKRLSIGITLISMESFRRELFQLRPPADRFCLKYVLCNLQFCDISILSAQIFEN